MERLIDKEKTKLQNLRITFVRHSIKGMDGNLTPDGITLAEEYGNALVGGRNVKIYTSDIQRSIDTGQIIYKQLETPLKPRVSSILSEFPYTDEKIEELGLSGGKWMLLKEDSEFLPSTKFMAGRISSFVLDTRSVFIKSKYHEDLNVIAVSHVPPLMCFLGHILALEQNKDFIDEDVRAELLSLLGGNFIRPLHGFEITFPVNTKGCLVSFSSRSIDLPLGFLETVAESAGK